VVSLHEAETRRLNFGQVENAFIRIYDLVTGREIGRYDLHEDFIYENALEFGKLYKKDDQWRFMALGEGYTTGLQGLVDKYA
jgi:tellurium resistance protein TerD